VSATPHRTPPAARGRIAHRLLTALGRPGVIVGAVTTAALLVARTDPERAVTLGVLVANTVEGRRAD
jgi:hypothetical protein